MEGLEECCSRCTTAAELPSPLCNGDQKYKQSSDHRPTTFFSSSFSQRSQLDWGQTQTQTQRERQIQTNLRRPANHFHCFPLFLIFSFFRLSLRKDKTNLQLGNHFWAIPDSLTHFWRDTQFTAVNYLLDCFEEKLYLQTIPVAHEFPQTRNERSIISNTCNGSIIDVCYKPRHVPLIRES